MIPLPPPLTARPALELVDSVARSYFLCLGARSWPDDAAPLAPAANATLTALVVRAAVRLMRSTKRWRRSRAKPRAANRGPVIKSRHPDSAANAAYYLLLLLDASARQVLPVLLPTIYYDESFNNYTIASFEQEEQYHELRKISSLLMMA